MRFLAAAGELRSSTIIKRTMKLSPDATYDDYARHPALEDIHAEVGLNLSNAFRDTSAADQEADALLERSRQDAKRAGASAADSQDATWHDEEGHGAEDASTSSYGVSGRWQRRRARRGSAFEAAGGGLKGGGEPRRAAKGAKVKGRRVRARVWMASDFPLNQKQLLPLLDVMGSTNKYLRKVSTFMAAYGDMELFPVRPAHLLCGCVRGSGV